MRFCPFAQRAHLVLDAKKIPYHTVNVNLTDKPDWLVQKSPLLKVPALEIPGEKEPVIESLIIADYLDEQYGDAKLTAPTPIQRARDRILMERMTLTIPLYSLLNETSLNAEKDIADIYANLALYEDELRARGSVFFGGAKPGMLDFMIWPFVERVEAIPLVIGVLRFSLDEERYAKLLAWIDAMRANETVKKSFAAPGDHVLFMEKRRAKQPNAYDILAL